MIKINLKPSMAEATMGAGDVGAGDMAFGEQEIQKKGLINLVTILAVPVGLYIFGSQLKPDRLRQVSSLQSQINELAAFNQTQGAIVAEIKKIQEDEKKVQDRIAAVSKVTLGRLVEVQVIDLVQTSLRERMWLKSLEIDEGDFLLEGVAQSEVDVQGFQDDLTKNVLLSNVSLVESAHEPYEGQSFTRFKIRATLERPK